MAKIVIYVFKMSQMGSENLMCFVIFNSDLLSWEKNLKYDIFGSLV